MRPEKVWQEARHYTPEQLEQAYRVLEQVRRGVDLDKAVRNHPLPGGGYIGKHVLVHAYRQMIDSGEWEPDPDVLRRIRMKPVRTLSGVTTVTVLTGPYPCPGECIFCPDDARMPKSYLPDEPGAMRGLFHAFDPYDQTAARIEALESIGHPTDKIELLILGGTWSVYPRDYQEEFVKRCLEAMNGFESESLGEAQIANQGSDHKNVGLVIETRPDRISMDEVAWLRSLGVTKVQLGAQSLDDQILACNQRGHSVEDTRQAIRLLRAAGIKIVLHWMPNLLKATLESDRQDFLRIWQDPDIRPDELKIYPCQLLRDTALHGFWERGEYHPYSMEALVDLIADLKTSIPRYCRVNRVVRDIPSTNIVAGSKRSSLRQDVQREMHDRGERCECIRCREVGGVSVDPAELRDEHINYAAGGAAEHFLAVNTPDGLLVGYLRLSLPGDSSPDTSLEELEGAALVRELHIYGQSLPIGVSREGVAQHVGLGEQLMDRAERIAKEKGFRKLAVIAALGTRQYYQRLGYALDGTYMIKSL